MVTEIIRNILIFYPILITRYTEDYDDILIKLELKLDSTAPIFYLYNFGDVFNGGLSSCGKTCQRNYCKGIVQKFYTSDASRKFNTKYYKQVYSGECGNEIVISKEINLKEYSNTKGNVKYYKYYYNNFYKFIGVPFIIRGISKNYNFSSGYFYMERHGTILSGWLTGLVHKTGHRTEIFPRFSWLEVLRWRDVGK